jgi:ATP-dependent helicase/DNAse subunit B
VRIRLERGIRRALGERLDWSDYRIAAIEKSFGPATRPLVLDTAAGPVRIAGRIDRIDQHTDGTLAVIDYKSSSSVRSLRDTTEGVDVQLPLYLLAAEQLFAPEQRVTRAVFLHLGSGKFSAPLTDKDRDATLATLYDRLGEIVQGARAGQFAVRPRDECAPGCAFAGICRLHLPKRDAQPPRT